MFRRTIQSQFFTLNGRLNINRISVHILSNNKPFTRKRQRRDPSLSYLFFHVCDCHLIHRSRLLICTDTIQIFPIGSAGNPPKRDHIIRVYIHLCKKAKGRYTNCGIAVTKNGMVLPVVSLILNPNWIPTLVQRENNEIKGVEGESEEYKYNYHHFEHKWSPHTVDYIHRIAF